MHSGTARGFGRSCSHLPHLTPSLAGSSKSTNNALLQHRKDNLSPIIKTYVEEIEQRREKQGRTEDDHPIAFKFALIASFLGFGDLYEAVDEFDDMTRHRNAIAHGYDFDEATLPTVKVWILLCQLVRLHLARLTKYNYSEIR
jgi:hypothetical protein